METIVTVVTSLIGGGVITAVIQQWFSRKKTKAEATNITVDGAVRWAESMRKDIDDLRAEVKEVRISYEKVLAENFELRTKIVHLEYEINLYKNTKV